MRPSNQKVNHDFASNRGRSILVVLSIAVGLFAIGVILTLWLCLSEDLRKGYEESNPANIYFTLTDFDDNLVRNIEKMPEVANVQGGGLARLRVLNNQNELNPILIQAASGDTWTNNRPEVIEGKWPLDKGEIALENYKFGKLGYHLGDTLYIKTDSGKLVPLVLAARVRDQTLGVIEYSQVFMASNSGYVSSKTLRSLELSEEWNLLRVVVNGDGNDPAMIERTAETIKDKIEKSGTRIISTTQALTSVHPTADYTDAIASTLFIIGILILFLSGTLIYNTLSAILTQQIKQIGAMKTIGATSGKLLRMYMRLIFLYSVIALVIAIPSSYFVADWFRKFLAVSINYRIMRTGIVWETVVVQVLLGLIVPQVAGAIPVSNGVRISIQNALNNGGSQNAKGNRSASLSWFTRIFPRPVALSMRNMFTNKMRLTLTLLTLSIGGAIFIATFNVTETIGNHVLAISQYYKAELSVNMAYPYRADRTSQDIAAIPGVSFVEGWGSGTAVLKLQNKENGPTIGLLSPPENSQLVQSKMKSGRWFNPGEKNVIVLSERFLHAFPEIKVGDEVTLDINYTGNETQWKVIGFFTMAGKSGGYLGYIPLDSWREVSGNGERLKRFDVKLINGNNPETIHDDIRRIEKALEEKGYTVQLIQRNDKFIDEAAYGLNVLSVFMFIMAILIAIVGSIGMTGTMSLNVMERTREIGILRAIGASDKAVLQNILTEGVMIGLMSWVGGIILSFPVMKFLSDAMGIAIFGSTMEFSFTWVGYVLWLAISILFALLACIFPARSAIRLTIQEVLSIE